MFRTRVTISLAALAAFTGVGVGVGASAAVAAPARTDMQLSVGSVSLSYRIEGLRNGPPILLICGTGMQMIEWPRPLIVSLVARGYRVITFDNRDAGRSSHFLSAGAPDWTAIFGALAAGKAPSLPYQASDMAADTIGLLDRLKIDKVDILGASGGATIAELIAIAQPQRVRSLTLLMANSGDPTIPFPADPKRTAAIPPPLPVEAIGDQIERRIKTYRALAGRGFPINEVQLRRLAMAAVARDADPQGVARQGAALIVLGDLRPRLTAITVPTVVIHGSDDPLIAPSAGRGVAEAISGARFILIDGMGHDLPIPIIGRVLDAVATVAARRP